MGSITYIEGDLFDAPLPKFQAVVIAHGCNNRGLWGAGFVVPLGIKYPQAKKTYITSFMDPTRSLVPKPQLGDIQRVMVSAVPMVLVANMITQDGIKSDNPNKIPFKYESFEVCLERLAEEAKKYKALIRMPKIGAGLGMGDWDKIESIITRVLIEKHNLKVEVYVL